MLHKRGEVSVSTITNTSIPSDATHKILRQQNVPYTSIPPLPRNCTNVRTPSSLLRLNTDIPSRPAEATYKYSPPHLGAQDAPSFNVPSPVGASCCQMQHERKYVNGQLSLGVQSTRIP